MAYLRASVVVFVLLLSCPADQREELWTSARKGDARAIEAVLAKGADVNAKTHYGATALWFAAFDGHRQAIEVLLKHGADPNVRDSVWGETPLSMSVDEKRIEIAKMLVDAGARDVDASFLSAVFQGKAGVARALLEKGHPQPETLSAALAAGQMRSILTKAGAKPLPREVTHGPNLSLKEFAGKFEDPAGQQYELAIKDEVLTAKGGSDFYVLKASGVRMFRPVAHRDVIFTFTEHEGKITGLKLRRAKADLVFERAKDTPVATAIKEARPESPVAIQTLRNWPSFRGVAASGVAEGQMPPTTWDVEKGINILWKTPIPGLAHSSPIIWGDRVFLTTAVSSDPKTQFKPGLYGEGTSASDVTPHRWVVYCLDKRSGKTLWDRTAHEGVPKVKRHIKSSHANATPATDGEHLVVSFASEGLYCYDFAGNLGWKTDLGIIDVGAFNYPELQWGAASSPIIYHALVIVQCDRHKDSYIAAFDIRTGERRWYTPRDEIPSWGTPTIYEGPDRVELITNGTNYIRGYDPETGKELWRLGGNSEITVPAPIAANGLIFVASGYRPVKPIYAILPGANGDISLKDGAESNSYVAWSKQRGGPYMPTPIVYGPYLYTCSNNGMITCYEARSGKQIYQQRIGGHGGYSASPVATDGRLYFPSEEGEVRVVKAGPRFELIAINRMGDACMASPAISDGMIFVRTQHYFFGVGRK
jgi:outer membrane protein assembly factor BamB